MLIRLRFWGQARPEENDIRGSDLQLGGRCVADREFPAAADDSWTAHQWFRDG